MIAAVATTRNEFDIIDMSLRHLLNEGVDQVLIADASTDDTREVLESFRPHVEWLVDDDKCHAQLTRLHGLAYEAHARGASWIIPWDADEFYYGLDGKTIAEQLVGVGAVWQKVFIHPRFNHVDLERRYVLCERWPKVAYRWAPGACLTPGCHDVMTEPHLQGLLGSRHWMFRSFEQLKDKMRDRIARLEPHLRRDSHVTPYEGASDEQLWELWQSIQAQPTVYDPIPLRLSASESP